MYLLCIAITQTVNYLKMLFNFLQFKKKSMIQYILQKKIIDIQSLLTMHSLQLSLEHFLIHAEAVIHYA